MNTVLGALNPIALRLGPIQVHWYGVIIASAVVIAVALAVREGQRRGVRPVSYTHLTLPTICSV